ncbi:MAG: nicotianamine synthase family protein, partial [Actinomycetota bacterium]
LGGIADAARGGPLDLPGRPVGVVARGLLAEIEARVQGRLDADPTLARRATDLRRAAGLAETELERHHAGRLLDSTGTAADVQPNHRTGTADATTPSDDPLDLAMGSFPYVHNYRLLVTAELAGLARFRRPHHLTFCGAGALPLTGILAHRQSGAAVRLIEIEPETADLARAVLDALDRRHVVDAALLDVETGDAGAVDLSDSDVIVVASLVPMATVSELVDRLRRLPVDRRPLLVVRSASGLVGHFAYDPIDPSTIVAAGGYRHVGTVAPAGREPLTGPPLLGRADPSVLNTSEYFVPAGAPHRR